MKHKFLAGLLALAVGLFSAPAYSGNFSIDFDQTSVENAVSLDVEIPKAPAPRSAPKSATQTSLKDWTVMVFINGKNNLELPGLFNMSQMESVGSTDKVNIVVELGRMNGQQGDTAHDGNWTGSRRYLVIKDNDPEKITSPILMKTENVDMGDYRRVVDFAKWTKRNFPARHYMLILWDHGTGWFDPQKAKKGKTDTLFSAQAISFDDETGNFIGTVQIGTLMKEIGKLDIVAFDACLMNMVEVAYEIKDYADIVIGAEENIPGYGYNYTGFLKAIVSDPGADAEKFSSYVVSTFKSFYTQVRMGAQLAAIRTSKLPTLAQKLDQWIALAMAVNDTDAVRAARKDVLRFDVVGPNDTNKQITFYGDLYNFIQIFDKNVTAGGSNALALKKKGTEILSFITRSLVIAAGYYGTDRLGTSLANAHSVSIYLPPAGPVPQEKLETVFGDKYTNLAFAKATKWYDFVKYVWSVPLEKPAEAAKLAQAK